MKKLLFFINVLTIISFAQTKHITIPRCADISLNKIILQDTISSRVVLGAENIIPSQYAPPFEFKFLNNHKTQLLTCTFHPGDYLYSLSEFKVEMYITDDKKFLVNGSDTGIIILSDIFSFKSGKEIELGFDSSDVTKFFWSTNQKN